MEHTKKFYFKDEISNESILVEFKINQDELNILKRFTEYLEDLLKTKIILEKIPTQLRIEANKEKGVSFSVNLPPDDDIIVFLYKLRPLILESEYASFHKVIGILGKRIESQLVRNFLKVQNSIFNIKRLQKQFTITFKDQIINSEEALFKWLNSFEYHRDEEKRREIEKLNELLPMEATKAIFLFILTEKIKAIFNVYSILQVVFGRHKKIELIT